MSQKPEITVARDGGAATVTGAGDLDLHVGQQFDDALMTTSADADSMTVDLCRAHFIDSAILASLAKCAKLWLSRGKQLRVLVAPSSHPAYAIRIVGFADVMDVVACAGEPES